MKWKVTLSDIDIGTEEIKAVSAVLRSKWLTMGEVTRRFEEAFAAYLGVKHAFAVANCTAALHIAHQALGIKEGDEVICPSLTFVATSNSILYTGATAVFADITSFDDLNISPENILEKITVKTKAITVVHYGGYPCAMDKIMRIAKRRGLYVIEDTAHAPGAEFKGRKAGTLGDIGCFSFFSNKNMTTGEGGMIVTNNDKLAEKIRLIRSHGMTTLTLDRHKGHAFTYDVTDLGYNYRIDEMRSAIGLVQLKKLDRNNEKRRKLADYYKKHLKEIRQISVPFSFFKGKSSFHIFPILLNDKALREEFMTYLAKKGIQTSIHYHPVHSFSFYRTLGCKNQELPITEDVCQREVTLPLYPDMNIKMVDYIVGTIKSFYGKNQA